MTSKISSTLAFSPKAEHLSKIAIPEAPLADDSDDYDSEEPSSEIDWIIDGSDTQITSCLRDGLSKYQDQGFLFLQAFDEGVRFLADLVDVKPPHEERQRSQGQADRVKGEYYEKFWVFPIAAAMAFKGRTWVVEQLKDRWCGNNGWTEPERGRVQTAGSRSPGMLALAAFYGDTALVEHLLSHEEDKKRKEYANTPHKYFGFPLYAAASRGCGSMIKLLLKTGADVNATGGYYNTALQAAVCRGSDEVIQLLLAAGADIYCGGEGTEEVQEGRYAHAFEAAVVMGNVPLVASLLHKGVDVNETFGDNRKSILRHISWKSHEDVIMLLVKYGLRVDARDKNDKTLLDFAAQRGDKEMVRKLLESEADVGANGTALYLAARGGHTEVLRLLLLSLGDKADVDDHSVYNETPLYAAAAEGHENAVQCLLENGADPSIKNWYGGLALDAAAGAGHLGVTKILLVAAFGAGEDVRNEQKSSALRHAASNGHAAVVQALLDDGAALWVDENGRSTLSVASEKGYDEIVRLLLAYRPDELRPTRIIFRALEEAANVAVIQELLHVGIDLSGDDNEPANRLVHRAVANNRCETVDLLLGHKVDLTGMNEMGHNVLHSAIWRRHEDLAIMLIERGGIDINAADSSQRTALHVSAWTESERLTAILANTTNINMVDKNKWTPLHFAAWVGNKTIVRLLVDMGSNLHAKSKTGETPLHLAEQERCVEVVGLLKHVLQSARDDITGN